MKKEKQQPGGIVLPMFGTSVESGLSGLLNIRDKVKERFPETPVRIAFTSHTVRHIWHERAKDSNYGSVHQEVPHDILNVQDPLAAIAGLQEEGFASIVVQPVYIAPTEEFLDLLSSVDGLRTKQTMSAQIAPFSRLVVGRPALGYSHSQYPCSADITKVAQSLAADIELAGRENASLVYMGHGSRNYPFIEVYLELEAEMERLYPDTLTAVITLDGLPTIDDAVVRLKKHNVEKVLLKPFMIVAGNHARRDMTGDKPVSLQNRLEAEEFTVKPVVRGLGEQDEFARIFVQHAADAASDAGIKLT